MYYVEIYSKLTTGTFKTKKMASRSNVLQIFQPGNKIKIIFMSQMGQV